MTIDGYRFVGGPTRRLMQAWAERDAAARDAHPGGLPWTPRDRPLAEARVAIISSAAVVRLDDEPFDQEGERRDPWWGDPTHRVLPREVTTADVRMDHMHIDPRPVSEDLDCLLPLRRLDELVEAGVVGASARDHYSFMGYILDSRQLLEETVPRIVEGLVRDEVDLVLLVPV